jgi:hypothetical protein
MAEFEIAELEVPYPDSSDIQLQLSVGACRLHVKPGNGQYFVEGTYEHPAGTLPPKVEMAGGRVKISQDVKMGDIAGVFKAAPKFELLFGRDKPYGLKIETGAIEGQFDLGGLPLTRLVIKEGAGDTHFDFSAPNPQEMSLLDIDAGAVNLEVRNLANANFSELKVSGGAASYRLHFGGKLRRAAHVDINTGLAAVEIIIPHTTAAKVSAHTTLASVDLGDGFMKKDGAFWTQAAVDGMSPLLTIHLETALGSVSLRTE